MRRMLPVTTRAERADVEYLSRVIAAAFHDLAATVWLVPDEKDREEIMPGFFELVYVQPALSQGGQLWCTADRMAAAAWIRINPDRPVPLGEITTMEKRIAEVTGVYCPTFRRFDALLETAHAHHDQPHDYLGVLGVHPVAQKQGCGSALLRDHTTYLDQVGLPAYLEAAHDGLVGLYRRFGFDLTGHIIVLPSGDEMYPMWREPATGRAVIAYAADRGAPT